MSWVYAAVLVMLPSAAIDMRKSPSYFTLSLLALGLVSLQGCQAPKPEIFILDSIKVLEPGGELRDVLTWPVVAVGPVRESLSADSLDIILNRLQEGLIQKRFSALSLERSKGFRLQYGGTEAGAVRAVKAAKADAVLILSLGEWDETRLFTLGKIRAKGEIKLLDGEGRRCWGGDLRVDSKLVSSAHRNASLEEKRRLAVESFARQLARRLPPAQF